MWFSKLFDPFIQQSPISVMARGGLQYALSPQLLDALFCRTAQRQYTRELLFSSVVDVLGLVVCGTRPSVHAAFQACKQRIGVSVTSLYNKLDSIEPQVSGALVCHSAQQLGPVIEAMGASLPPLLPGYRLKIIDGNHLASTQRRLQVLRTSQAPALPGLALVVLDPERMLAVDVVPCEDGHAQERSLTAQLLQRVAKEEVWLGDRNFSTAAILFGIADKGAWFVIRQHAKNPSVELLSSPRRVQRIDTGVVFEQQVRIQEGKRTLLARRILLELDKPTRDGDTRLALLTNLPLTSVGAQKIAKLYAQRWSIEKMFGELSLALRAELNTLGYPKAALLAFCIGLVTYNVLSTMKAALRAKWGQTKEQQLSTYHLADEISSTYRGMMIAIPEPKWKFFEELQPQEMGSALLHLAGSVQLSAFRSHPRGPKKAEHKKKYVSAREKSSHVSTARLLAAAHSPP